MGEPDGRDLTHANDLDGPYKIVLDYDGTPITWSFMYASDRTFHIRMDDLTIERHRERMAVADCDVNPSTGEPYGF